MTRTKKIIVVSLSAALLLLVAVMLFVTSGIKKDDLGIWLSQRPVSDIVSIQISDRKKDNVLLMKNTDGKWLMDGVEINQEKVAPTLAVLGYMKAAYMIEDEQPDLSQYELEDPCVVVNVQYTDGDKQIYMLGKFYADTGTYMIKQDDKKIYILDQLRSEVLLTLSEAIMELPLDQVNYNNIVGVNLKSPRQGEISFDQSESPRSEVDFYWRMSKPYYCNVKTQSAQDLINSIKSIGWVKEVKGAESDDTYGLSDETVRTCTIYDAFDRKLEIRIGNVKGSRAYCKINDMPGVYLIDSKITSVFDLSAEEIIDPTLYYYEVASVTDCAITMENAKHVLQAVWVKDKTAEKQAQRFLIDGESLPSADYHNIAAAMEDIKWDVGPIDESELGEEAGVFIFKRMSAPYEQMLTFREVKDQPDYVSVDYGNGALGVLKKDELQAFMSKIEDMKGGIPG